MGVGLPVASRPRLVQRVDGCVQVTARRVQQSQAAHRVRLPARVVDLAAEGERVIEALRGALRVARAQVDLADERFGGGHERGPALLEREPERAFEGGPRLRVLGSQEL